ncbi:MAG: hypothetical protein ABSG43_01715 [Solirubrobacteraceae bacterium]
MTSRRGAAIVVLVVLAGALLARLLSTGTAICSPKPGVAYTGRVGVVVSDNLYESPERQIEAGLAQVRAGGVSWIREDLTWAVAEPTPGVFDWAPFDRLMAAAAGARVHVLGILDYSAPWASSDPSGSGDPLYPPNNDSEFAAYAAAVAARYGSRGSFWAEHLDVTPDPLTAVEIWNEPYGSWDWASGPSATAYAALVSQAAPAIHAVDPRIAVLMSGDLMSWDYAATPQHQPWLERLLAAAPAVTKLVNGLDVHPYPSPENLGPDVDRGEIANLFGRVSRIRQLELAAGVNLPIWITEIGWSTAPDTAQAVSDPTQASYLCEAVQRSLGEWGSFVPKIFVFGWFRASGRRGDLAGNFGLLDRTGAPTPAWIAIAHLLGGKPGTRDVSVPAVT